MQTLHQYARMARGKIKSLDREQHDPVTILGAVNPAEQAALLRLLARVVWPVLQLGDHRRAVEQVETQCCVVHAHAGLSAPPIAGLMYDAITCAYVGHCVHRARLKGNADAATVVRHNEALDRIREQAEQAVRAAFLEIAHTGGDSIPAVPDPE